MDMLFLVHHSLLNMTLLNPYTYRFLTIKGISGHALYRYVNNYATPTRYDTCCVGDGNVIDSYVACID